MIRTSDISGGFFLWVDIFYLVAASYERAEKSGKLDDCHGELHLPEFGCWFLRKWLIL